MKKTVLALALAAALAGPAQARNFSDMFRDSTLRVDYVLSGTDRTTDVALHGMSKTAGWAGRRVNLHRAPYQGNGMITVIDTLTRDTVYRQSFSSLFQEWQTTDEARQMRKAFEGSYLVPMPKRAAWVQLDLFNTRHQTVATSRHLYRPDDILVQTRDSSRHVPYTYIHKGGDPKDVIDVAIVAEGYSAAEMDKFNEHARQAVEALFTHEPFNSRRANFNFVAVQLPSAESGISVPRENRWLRTALGSHFDTFYSNRYLTTSRVFDLYDALDNIPYEHIIILANTEVYGGGGIFNSYTLTTTQHPKFVPVVVHEFGHSFGGLGDEYFYGSDIVNDVYPAGVEPWEPNVTTLSAPGAKWQDMLQPGIPVPTAPADSAKYPVGVYEGAGYVTKGVYRPADRCRMRDNDWPAFCPVCERALNRLINFYLYEDMK